MKLIATKLPTSEKSDRLQCATATNYQADLIC